MTNAQLLTDLQTALAVEVSGAESVSDQEIFAFLDALIVARRGPPERAPAPPGRLTNNLVLKKLRVALDLKEPAVLATFAAGGLELTAREVTPLFRKPGTTHHRRCTDEMLQAFLAGLRT